MKFLTAKYEKNEFVGLLLDGNSVLNLTELSFETGLTLPPTLLECIAAEKIFKDYIDILLEAYKDDDTSEFEYQMDDPMLQILSPISRPTKNILCVGKNYKDHAIEMGSVEDIPEHPMIFTKAPTSVIGPGENVLLHEGVTNALDYEGELAVVIGKTGVGIKEEDAYNHIFGYTILNDITARDMQTRHKQFFLGKSLDTSCPLGPYIVHKSEIEDPHNLALQTKVNGEVRQNGYTGDMIFDIPKLIAVLSKGMTLEAGDIIATGTPAGVGKGFKPPRYLKSGDVIEISIDQIGTLRNVVL
jgi:2-keto-4-pentenoate hydratase/2-oxohepta-3-ene-1,7-dioic acid hydratase in catechol pathway